MNNIIERMDTFETEDLVYQAKMSHGDMDKMAEYIDLLGEQLVLKDTSLQSFLTATSDSVSASKMEQITNLSAEYMNAYMNRFTTDEMKEKLAKEGLANLAVVLVDADFANEAIDNGRDVFALKNGNMVLLEKYRAASEYEAKGYLIAVSPFTYEAEFLNILE